VARVSARIPTGVNDFDHITGGLPVGSTLLLTGEPGAGAPEFALSSAAALMTASHRRDARGVYMGRYQGPVALPGRVTYVSLTRSREQLLHEADSAFPEDHADMLASHLDFVDLSSAYFRDSVVPRAWSDTERSVLDEAPAPPSGAPPSSGDILSDLAAALDAKGKGALLIVDSLTDLLVRRSIPEEELLTLVKGLRRRAKSWNGLVYLLLTRGVADPRVEQGLKDSTDAVLDFTWVRHATRSVRTRALLIEKSMPLLAYVPQELQGRFLLDVKGRLGLVTTQYERIG
jgi:KaiC/GvpD/RAD55 family RecA-like ATPase